MEGSEVLYGRPRPTLTFACAYTAAIGRLLIIVNVRGEGKDMMTVSRAGLAPCTCFGVGMFYTPRVRGLVRVLRTYQNATFPCSFWRHERCQDSSHLFSSYSFFQEPQNLLDAMTEI